MRFSANCEECPFYDLYKEDIEYYHKKLEFCKQRLTEIVEKKKRINQP